MSQSTNKGKYDVLLNKFLENDSLCEEYEKKEMERWLREAEISIRSQFQNHRGSAMEKSIMLSRDYVCLCLFR